MTFSLNITARAEADIDELIVGIQRVAPDAVAGWYFRLTTAIHSLEFMPGRWPAAEEADDLGIDLRELIFGKRRSAIRILFTIEGQTVNVLHVCRAMRGPVQLDDLS